AEGIYARAARLRLPDRVPRGRRGQPGDGRRRREVAGLHAVAPRARSAAVRLPRGAAPVDAPRAPRRRRVRGRGLTSSARAARAYVAQRQAPEVEIARATQIVASAGGAPDLPVLVASGYVVARHSSDVGVKSGGRIARLAFEEGTRVRKGAVIAEIEHADVEALLEASRRAVAEAEAQRAQAAAARDEDIRNLE